MNDIKQKHNPTEWALSTTTPYDATIKDAEGDIIVECWGSLNGSGRANAEHIVHCVNHYPNLVEKNNRLLTAAQGVLDATCCGDHGNIKDGPYICLSSYSPEIKALVKAIAEGK